MAAIAGMSVPALVLTRMHGPFGVVGSILETIHTSCLAGPIPLGEFSNTLLVSDRNCERLWALPDCPALSESASFGSLPSSLILDSPSLNLRIVKDTSGSARIERLVLHRFATLSWNGMADDGR